VKSTVTHPAKILVDILGMRFKPMADHSVRVAEYSLMLARQMAMPVEMQKIIYLAGLVHDIGKIGISSACLLKHGPLTVDDWEEIKKHPRLSYEILSSIPGMEEVALMALYHHERYDGRGYPEGLSGEAIPLGARVIAVADSFDAMTSERVYRPTLSRREAENEIRRCVGTQFDPQVVKVFCRLMMDGGV